MRRLLALGFAVVAAAVVHAPRAGAGGDFFVGVDEDAVRWGRTELAASVLRSLGVKAVRVALPWHAGQTQLSAPDRQLIDRAVVGSWGLRLVVSVYGTAAETPRTEEARGQYCDYLGDLVAHNPSVADVVVWNDPNDATFWSPQLNPDGSSAAPADYEALLARCWSTLHGIRPSVNVIAASSSQSASMLATDAVTWFRRLGEAYRASDRHQPVLDTFGYVAHGTDSAERPWARHHTSPLGEGDYNRLMGAISAAFGGTAQPLPGQGATSIWYLGQGFQTVIDPAKARFYDGRETDRMPVTSWSAAAAADKRRGPAPDQATQLADAVRVAYCQPKVGAYFNFHLADESSLAGWQSGVLWADWTPKPSYGAFRRVVSDVGARNVNCAAFSRAGVPPRPAAAPATVLLVLSNVHAAILSPTSATISWRSSVATKAQVAYGLAESGPTLWADARDSGTTHTTTLTGLSLGTTYRVWLSVVADDGQRAQTSLEVRATGAPRAPTASIGGGAVLLNGQPFFPEIVWSQCPDGYAADLAAGVNLFSENPCGGLQPQLDSLAGRALSAAVAGKDAGGNGGGLVGFFYPDEPDGLGLTAAQLPPRPTGSAGQLAFLTLTNHFYSGAAPLNGGPAIYPPLIARSDVIGFDLYPLQEWCRPERLGDVFSSQQELAQLSAPKPTFQWIEAAEWNCPGGATAVTPATVAAESWLAIAGGAHGLGFFPAVWSPAIGGAIAGVSRDIAKLGPALLAPSIAADSDHALVKVGARAHNGAVYVIAVNAGYSATQAAVRVPGLGVRTLDVLDEGRQVTSNAGAFADSFAPLGVHVYVAPPVG